ncbi:MAG: type VI secretion protein IcmF/TssM N-terminal domain-containing protein, partial [Bacteroidota bacterium]
MSGTTAHQIFDTEFKLLCQSLHSKRMGRLTSAWGSQKIRDIYSFPLQLSSGHERLKRFVELLFQQNTYHENPVFRGFYFTSGTQEGAPIDRIIGAMGRASGLPDVISEVFEAHKEPKSYFLKNLFTDVIFPDHLLAGPSSSAGKKQGYMKVGVFAGSAAATVIALIGLSLSFVGNKHLLGAVNSAINELTKINILNEGQFVTDISYLDRLRTRVEQLQIYDEDGIPLRLRGGLYRGGTIYPAALTLYFGYFNNIFLDSTRSAMDVELEGFVSNPNKLPANRDSGYYYSVLKAYLMMSDPAHIEPVFLDQWLQKIWKDFLIGQYGVGGMPEGLSE